MDSGFELKLIECLSLLDDGEPVERILARYPNEAEQLRALLEVASVLPALRIEPSEAARAESRRAFLNHAHDLRETLRPRRLWLPARLAIGLAALVLVFVFAGGAVAASSSALPNDPLYSVKRGVEGARLLLASQPDRASLALQFEQRRRDEVARLLGERRAVNVAFDGQLQAIQPGQWMVSGLPVQVDSTTVVSGIPGINARLHVQGRTDNGQLRATSIQIEPGTGLPPTAMPTATPMPTATARPTATHVPTPTVIATAPPTAMPSPTATPIPTQVPTARPAPIPVPSTEPPPPPTQQPEPQPDDNQNGDDNGADNHGGGDDTNRGGDTNNGSDGTNDNSTDDHGGSGSGDSGSDGASDNTNDNSTDDHGGSGSGGSGSGGASDNTNDNSTDDHGGSGSGGSDGG